MKYFYRLMTTFFVATLLSACTLTVSTDLEKNDKDADGDQQVEDTEEGTEASEDAGEEASSAAAEEEGTEEEADEEAMEEVSGEEEGEESSEEAPEEGEAEDVEEAAAAPAARSIQITTEDWKFTPNTIVIKKGEDITLELLGISGEHGFSIPGLNINAAVSAGQTMNVPIPTDVPGTYNFLCTIPCGPGHTDMTGTIVIE